MRTFRSLRHRNYRLYFAGQLVSLVGSWTQITALMWLAHQYTDSARWPAFLAAVQIGPTFLLGPWGGSLADRVCKRGLIMRTQCVFLSCALALLGLYLFDALSVTAMLIVMFVHGMVQAIDLPARLSFVPGLVARADLANAVALNSLLFNVARAIGPALAGVLLALGPSGTLWCFAINAGSYVVVIAALAWIRVPPEASDGPPASDVGGFRVLARTPGLLALVLIAGMVGAGGWPLLPLLPSLSAKVFQTGEAGYGTLLSSVGLGALAVACQAVPRQHDPRHLSETRGYRGTRPLRGRGPLPRIASARREVRRQRPTSLDELAEVSPRARSRRPARRSPW